MVIYYFATCPSCKNYARNLVREVGRNLSVKYPQVSALVDERYVYALPSIWLAEAKKLHDKMPFLYDPQHEAVLEVDLSVPNMKEKVVDFIKNSLGT